MDKTNTNPAARSARLARAEGVDLATRIFHSLSSDEVAGIVAGNTWVEAPAGLDPAAYADGFQAQVAACHAAR